MDCPRLMDFLSRDPLPLPLIIGERDYELCVRVVGEEFVHAALDAEARHLGFEGWVVGRSVPALIACAEDSSAGAANQ